MKRLLKIRYIVLASCLVFLFNGCVDDGLGFSADDLRDGETTVMLDVSFSPFSEGNLTRANIENGNGKRLSDLKDLCILVYDSEGNLVDDTKYPMKIDLDSPEIKSNIKEVNRNDADASNEKTAETTTKTLSGLSLNLPFGRYYIVAVANLKGGTLTTLKANPENISTLKKLREMKVEWDNTKIENNSELMGYFTDTEMNSGVPSAIKSFETVSVNRPGMKLRAWLRRCASKITIDFDGSKLRENVTVYIQKAEIKAIPYDCTLGFGQPSGFNESETAYNHYATDNNPVPNGLLEDTPQVISYLKRGADNTTSEGDTEAEFVKPDGPNWAKITKGMPVIKNNVADTDYDTAETINFHSENADALYFYENMQDNPEPKKTKIPHADLENGGVASADSKDGIKWGTYIEVTGYYESNADGNYSHGKIVYRFMLGKNVTDNFEAERNYHYKLTLCPRGNGNDADWHIDFDEPKGFHVPNPWYVSYLYNHKAVLPFKYTPEEDEEIIGLKAKIDNNPWYPSDWQYEELSNTDKIIEPTTPPGDEATSYNNTTNNQPWNGFLSLRATNNVVVTDVMAKGEGNVWKGYGEAEDQKINKDYYYGHKENGEIVDKGIDRSQRTYLENGEIYNYTDFDDNPQLKEAEEFTYQKDGNSMSFNIPLFTRAKVLVKQTGYSGNNPFVDYQRIARVKLTVTLKNKKTGEIKYKDEPVNVVQVRRVVNPKGVYRDYNNFEPFHVKMMWLDDKKKEFEPVTSHGPWKAEIIGDKNFITLDGKQSVSGSTETSIDFTIRFNRTNNNKNTVKNAVVRILYHNYTCTHLIFVRQGYAPQELMPRSACKDKDHLDGGGTPTKWSTFNMIREGIAATDPRDEGSLFKFGNLEDAIDAYNNIHRTDKGNGEPMYHNLLDDEFNRPDAATKLRLVKEDGSLQSEEEAITWSDIKRNDNVSGDMAKAADMRDFEQLYLSDNMQFGYGVLYADGATTTQETMADAYGYYRRDTPSGRSHKGMRGLFVYYWDGKLTGGDQCNARNLFFPIGRSGYGHRKNYREGIKGDQPGYGILRYACNRGEAYPAFDAAAPIMTSMYRRPGAIYWCSTPTVALEWNNTIDKNNSKAYGLDINYFSFDVNLIYGSNVNMNTTSADDGDACFVRTVE